jgi:hypothetical protein
MLSGCSSNAAITLSFFAHFIQDDHHAEFGTTWAEYTIMVGGLLNVEIKDAPQCRPRALPAAFGAPACANASELRQEV